MSEPVKRDEGTHPLMPPPTPPHPKDSSFTLKTGQEIEREFLIKSSVRLIQKAAST